MPTPRKYDSQAERQAAYRAALRRAQEAAVEKGLPAIATIHGHPRWRAIVRTALAMLGCVHREMDDYYQARSEAWQEGERGEAFLERMDSLTETIDLLEELNTNTSKAKEKTTS